MSDGPIFVVGLPRSGTTLIATFLARHPRIDCGTETYFFRWLPKRVEPLLDPTTWPGPATDFVCSLRPGKEPKVIDLFDLRREDVEAYLASRPPSVPAMLESLTELHARAAGKPRWAEKSPAHLTRLALIRRTYPDAYILRMIRDPRDIALSMTRVPWASDSLLVDLYDVARRDRQFDRHARRDPQLMTVRFEDLVTDTEAVLRRVCSFLGEEFHPDMLADRERPATLGGTEEWWKEKAAQRPDPSRVAAWRREMDETDKSAASVICHEVLARQGYPDGTPPMRVALIEPEGAAFIRRREDVVRRLAIGGVVIGRGREELMNDRADLVFWPQAGADPWRLGRSRRRRATRLARMAALLGKRRLARRPAVWVRDPAVRRTGGAAESLLRLLARPTTPRAWFASLGIDSPDDVAG